MATRSLGLGNGKLGCLDAEGAAILGYELPRQVRVSAGGVEDHHLEIRHGKAAQYQHGHVEQHLLGYVRDGVSRPVPEFLPAQGVPVTAMRQERSPTVPPAKID